MIAPGHVTGLGKPLLPEIAFGGYLLVMFLLLLPVAGIGSRDTQVFFLLSLFAALVYWQTRLRATPWVLRLRLLYYPLAMNVAFQQLRSAVPLLHPTRQDDLLQGIDRFLLGETPSLLLQGWTPPLVADLFSFFYLLFFPYLLFSFIYYLFEDADRAVRFYSGLFVLYAAGFLGYLVIPAAGPWLALADHFTLPVQGGWLTRVNDAMVSQGSNGVDVFPSLHCAVSAYLLFFDRRCKPWRYRLYLLPCVGLWLSTLLLRYHYLVDVLAGFLLAFLCLRLAFSTMASIERG
ncbi:MAG: phosphatase PAP2 family protein [Magnetococcales bacterium]|nr:phosphatase PAP2 family protein [Magnetococcales bacterium]